MRTWEGKASLVCQPLENRDLSARIRAAVQAPTAALNLTTGTHQCQVTISSAAKCVSCDSSQDWQQLHPSGSPVCHQPHSTCRHRPTLCAPTSSGREVPCHASLFPGEQSMINRPRQGEPSVWALQQHTGACKLLPQLSPLRGFRGACPGLVPYPGRMPDKGLIPGTSPHSLNWPIFNFQLRSQCLSLFFREGMNFFFYL